MAPYCSDNVEIGLPDLSNKVIGAAVTKKRQGKKMNASWQPYAVSKKPLAGPDQNDQNHDYDINLRLDVQQFLAHKDPHSILDQLDPVRLNELAIEYWLSRQQKVDITKLARSLGIKKSALYYQISKQRPRMSTSRQAVSKLKSWVDKQLESKTADFRERIRAEPLLRLEIAKQLFLQYPHKEDSIKRQLAILMGVNYSSLETKVNTHLKGPRKFNDIVKETLRQKCRITQQEQLSAADRIDVGMALWPSAREDGISLMQLAGALKVDRGQLENAIHFASQQQATAASSAPPPHPPAETTVKLEADSAPRKTGIELVTCDESGQITATVMTAARPLAAGKMDNALPLLRHPDHPQTSLTLVAEQVDNVNQLKVDWAGLDARHHLKPAQKKELERTARMLVAHEGEELARYMAQLMCCYPTANENADGEIIHPGTGVFNCSGKEVAPGTVLGIYAGEFYRNPEEIAQLNRKRGTRYAVSHSWGTSKGSCVVDSSESGNILGYMNTAQLKHQSPIGENNVEVFFLGNNLVVYVTTKTVGKNQQFFVNYGEHYDPDKIINQHRRDERIANTIERVINPASVKTEEIKEAGYSG